MNYLKIIIKIFTFFTFFSTIAQNLNYCEKCKELLCDNLHNCRSYLITKECRGITLVKTYKNTDDFICLHIYRKDDLAYFLLNLDLYKNIKALYLSGVKIEDFEFLKKFSNLERISITSDVIKNYDSFVNNMNSSKVQLLDIGNINCDKYFNYINKLVNIRTLKIFNSKVRNVNLELKLDQLVISNCKSIHKIQISNIQNLSLENNEFNKMPKGLSEAPNLLALHISPASASVSLVPTNNIFFIFE